MMTLLNVELRKLNGSLALLLAVVAPAMPGVLAALSLMSGGRSVQWASVYSNFVLPVWCMFLAPMAIAAFTALLAQIEHRGRGWDHILALPLPRWWVFLAKAVVVLGAVLLMTVLALAFTALGGWIGGTIGGHVPQGPFPFVTLARQAALILASMAALVIIQLWVALRFASFVVPLSVGIGGTLVGLAVLMTRTQQAEWFPWVLPINVLMAETADRYAVGGAIGGLAILVIMIADLSRREAA